MQLVMNGRQIILSTRLQQYIAEKVSKLEKHCPTLGQVRTEVAEYTTHDPSMRYTCQLTTWFDRRLLRVEAAAADVKAAITAAVTKLDRQLRKQKIQHQHKGRPSIASMVERLTALSVDDQRPQ